MMLNDQEIDALIASVSKELENHNTLTKSQSLKKDQGAPPELDAEPGQDMAPEAPAPEMPAAEASAPAPEGAPEAPSEMAPDMAPQDGQPPMEGQPEGEPQMEGEQPPMEGQPEGEPDAQQDQQMSDEDLMQIYAGMEDQELERHALIAQEELSRRHGQESQPQAQHQSDMPLAASEKGSDTLRKSEQDEEIATLKKNTAELQQSIQLLTKAVEAGFKPVRKSVQGIEFIQRGEGGDNSPAPLSNEQLKAKLKEITKTSSLSKTERNMIDQYCMYGLNRDAVEKLVIGGK